MVMGVVKGEVVGVVLGVVERKKSMIDIGVKTTSSSINLIKQVEEGQVQSDSLMTLTSESFSIRKVFFIKLETKYVGDNFRM